MARLNPDGTLDTTFNGTGLLTFNDDLGGSPSSDSITAVALSGSQIVLAGTASEVFPSSSFTQNLQPSVTDVSVVRLNRRRVVRHDVQRHGQVPAAPSTRTGRRSTRRRTR